MRTRIEAETPQPLSLRDKIADRVGLPQRFLRGGEAGYPRLQRGGTVYLEVSTQFIIDMGLPEGFDGEMPFDPQRKARLILKSKGPLRVAQLTVFPKDDTAASTWRLEMPNEKEPIASYRRGKFSPPPIDYDPSFSDFFSTLIDVSRPWRKTPEDYLELVESWMVGWNSEEIARARESAKLAIEELGPLPPRKSREPQVEHAFETARILVEEFKIKNPVIISGGLLHDVPEDSRRYRQFNLDDEDPPEVIIPASQWQSQTIDKLTPRVGQAIAELAVAMARLKREGKEIESKQRGNEIYYDSFPENLQRILVKMADRLHNLRTLWAMPPANQRETIIETKTIYWPIFELAREQYPEAVDYGLSEQDKEMRALVASNPKLGIDYDSL